MMDLGNKVIMTTKTVLTRLELIRMATFMQLNANFDTVMIIQKHNSGIGASTWARFYQSKYPDKYQEIEVTDVKSW